jgi:hypothetical protein
MLGLSARALAFGAAAVALGVDVVYLLSVGLEDDADAGTRVALVAGTLALAGLLALAAALVRSAGARMVLATAAGTTLVFWGVLGLASIGIPLLVGAFLAASSAVRSAEDASPDAFRASIAVAVGVAVALVLAYALT